MVDFFWVSGMIYFGKPLYRTKIIIIFCKIKASGMSVTGDSGTAISDGTSATDASGTAAASNTTV